MNIDLVYQTLSKWQTAKEEDIQYVKQKLMPDDDHTTLTFKVTEHPNIKNNYLYIDWYDIEVYQLGSSLCDIVIYTKSNKIEYHWI